jgi:hypothetical protein
MGRGELAPATVVPFVKCGPSPLTPPMVRSRPRPPLGLSCIDGGRRGSAMAQTRCAYKPRDSWSRSAPVQRRPPHQGFFGLRCSHASMGSWQGTLPTGGLRFWRKCDFYLSDGTRSVYTTRPAHPYQPRGQKFMNKFLVTAIAAMLALSTACADAAKRNVAPRSATRDVHAASGSSYWMYSRCSPGARTADPNTVCFPSGTVRPYLGRDPDANVRLQMRRDYLRDNQSPTGN